MLRRTFLLATSTLLGASSAFAESKHSDAVFAAVKAAVKPYPGEDQYTQIPWITSLWDARTKAAADGKPILLWEMDGNPLGCG